MKLATLLTAEGPIIVGVHGTDDAPVFVPLNWVDRSLPKTMRDVLASEHGIAQCRDAMSKGLSERRVVMGTLLPPIPNPGKIICIGLNYRDHAIESGMSFPEEPICFGKFGNTIIGSGESIRLPKASQQVDYEAELVVVIGKSAYCVEKSQALNYVAGYCNGNDVSARDWQINKPGKQWMLGKTPDTFAPLGPWIVTADAIDPHNLAIELRLNGTVMQSGSTRELIFGVDHLIAYLSQLITLEPGDVIYTGTPPGVGMARTPPVWLKPGDTVEVSIEGLGRLVNGVTAL